jgi:hypothetical protein
MRSGKPLLRAKSRAFQALGGSCLDCEGVFPDCCYDIHHVHENGNIDRKTLGIKTGTVKWYRQVAENPGAYALLCANCHRRRHAR